MLKVCKQCQKEFEARPHRKFCSHSCAAKFNWKPYRQIAKAVCHPDRPLTGKGLCKSCYYKKYFKERPDKRRTAILSSRDGYLKRTYGMTEEQWNKLYELQDGKCPICTKLLYKPYNTLGKRAAAVDHDHKTGRVRGLTCFICNQHRIGMNSADTAKRLVFYLGSNLDGRTV